MDLFNSLGTIAWNAFLVLLLDFAGGILPSLKYHGSGFTNDKFCCKFASLLASVTVTKNKLSLSSGSFSWLIFWLKVLFEIVASFMTLMLLILLLKTLINNRMPLAQQIRTKTTLLFRDRFITLKYLQSNVFTWIYLNIYI